MTDVDVVAKAIRDAFDLHSQSKHGQPPLTAWDVLPEARKIKWRKMACAAMEVMQWRLATLGNPREDAAAVIKGVVP